IIVNTSFNLSWEPIVSNPEQAYSTFMQSELDVLVLENFVLHKSEQPLCMKVRVEANHPLKPEPDSPWADPVTGEPLVMTCTEAINTVSGKRYPVIEDIPRLFVPTEGLAPGQDVTEIVQKFYERTPFPNYDDLDNHRALLEKARSGLFARMLNEQIPYNARV